MARERGLARSPYFFETNDEAFCVSLTLIDLSHRLHNQSYSSIPGGNRTHI